MTEILPVELLSRRELEVINRRNHRYPLHVAEKDYLLSVVCRLIAASSLGGSLVFKGGTALHHSYLPSLRFSEDLDFTFTAEYVDQGGMGDDARSWSTRRDLSKKEVLDEIVHLLEQYDFLEVKKSYVSDFTIKIERLSFVGPLGQPNSLKIEVDMEQAVLLPPREIPYANVWKVNAGMLVMDIKEICAEKLRAVNERARYRDFYDLFMIIERLEPDLEVVAEILSGKEARRPRGRDFVEANWDIARSEKEADGHRIFYLEEVEDFRIEGMLNEVLPEVLPEVTKP